MATSSNRSFYKRELPDSCIAFQSRKGKKIFASALMNNGLKSFYALIQQFSTQTEPAYCGLTTLVLVLNALSVDPKQTWKGPWRWFSEEMLNCCVSLDEVQKSGITLQDFRCLAICQGLTAETTYADENDKTGVAKFRQAVQQACVENIQEISCSEDGIHSALVVSYSRKVLNQTGSGHFSPIAAYDSESDQVLILDTARFKYGAHWTKLELLFQAMGPIDTDSGKSRGYALLSLKPSTIERGLNHNNKTSHSYCSVQPISLLFESRLTQSPARFKYKQYLKSLSHEITWEQVIQYWILTSEDDTTCSSSKLWEILEPLAHPQDPTHQKTVRDLQELIQDLLQTNYQLPSICHKTCAGSHHALFVVYLASMRDELRRFKILQGATKVFNPIKEQLLNEAALIASAIETSDQNDLCCTNHECKGHINSNIES